MGPKQRKQGFESISRGKYTLTRVFNKCTLTRIFDPVSSFLLHDALIAQGLNYLRPLKLKSSALNEMLGMDAECVVVDSNKRPSQDEYKNTSERNLVYVALSIEASRILPKRY